MRRLPLPPYNQFATEARRLIAGGSYVVGTISADAEMRGFYLRSELIVWCPTGATDDEFLSATVNGLFVLATIHAATTGGHRGKN